jgi:hypothetical protein
MAQVEHVTTAIRELMSRGQPPKSTSPRAAHTEFIAAAEMRGHDNWRVS